MQVEGGYDANFVATGGNGGCRNDNLRCLQWRQVDFMTAIGFKC